MVMSAIILFGSLSMFNVSKIFAMAGSGPLKEMNKSN